VVAEDQPEVGSVF